MPDSAQTMLRRVSVAVFLLALSAAVSSSDAIPESIRHSGFNDFIQGKPGNSGVNLYVSRNGRVQVINQWDLNQDGYVDVLINNDHDASEIVDALIYWGSERGFTSLLPELWSERPLSSVVFGLMDNKASVTRLPSAGGGRSVIADLNGDGYPEIVFCNYIHNYPGIRSAYVYWGGQGGYDTTRRIQLPTNWAAGVAAADLNGDGYPDLVFANEGVEPGLEAISSTTTHDAFIYWGGATGFDPARRTLLATRGASDVVVADINKDGYPDIAFITNNPSAHEVRVFWGGASAYSNQRVQILALPAPTSIRAGDVNGDGFQDLVVTAARGVYVILGGADGLNAERMIQLASHVARDSCIGDFNGDGFADIAIANASDGKSTAVPSFIYWGSKNGFSADNRSELPTLGAAGVATGDLNGDGYPDLVFANLNDDRSFDVPSYIYWGSSTGFAPYLRSSLQSFGATSISIADMNRDGRPDVLLVNRNSGTVWGKQLNTHIFWGNPHHSYSTALMSSLPVRSPYGVVAGDLNDDGFLDLVFPSSSSKASWLYLGGKEGFSAWRRLDLPTGTVFGASAADLNRDGYLDLVFTGISDTGDNSAVILWGSPRGYTETNRTIVPLKMKKSESNLIADVNRDGFLDLIFPDFYSGTLQILWGSAKGYSESRSWTKVLSAGNVSLADLNGDGYLDFVVTGGFDPAKKSHNAKTRIFWGTPEGTPSPDGVVELEGYESEQCAIADLNHDGYLDLVLSNYMSDSSRSLPIYIYWGDKGGRYSNSNRTELPAESSCGIQVVDLNHDGYPDITVLNHLKDGEHTTNSYVYWNGPQGFDPKRRTELPSFGSHFSQMAEPGNLYTRKLEEEYISAPIHLPAGRQARSLKWKGQEPHRTKLKFQVRAAAVREALAKASWIGPNGEVSYYEESGAELRKLHGPDRWIQYRVMFTSPDGGEWPVLTEVEVGLST
ncbi:MAG: hypothetical protein DMG07_15875, partial [Acidobacteria bacterium]